MATIAETSDDKFNSEVLESHIPVLVDFSAEWCAPCRQLKPIVQQIADEYDGKMRVVEINTDQNMQTTMQYGVMSIPTLILFKGGQAAERITGFQPKPKLLEKIKKHIT